CRLYPDLPFNAVVPKAEVGWRRDYARHRFRRQDVGHALCLAAVNDSHLKLTPPRRSPSPPRARQTALPTAVVPVPLRAAGSPVQWPPQPAAGGAAASAGSAGPAATGAAGGRPWRSHAGTAQWRATLLRP